MSTSLIHKSSKIISVSSRPKRLETVPGIEACNPWLVWTAYTFLPLVAYPGITSLIAAAAWFFWGARWGALAAGLIVVSIGIRQARLDRDWFNVYMDCVTRLNGRPLRDGIIKRYLKTEYLRPLWVPLLWIITWWIAPNYYGLLLSTLGKYVPAAKAIQADERWLTSLAPIAISLGARELATRRRPKRQLPTIVPQKKIVVPEPPDYGPGYIRGTKLMTLRKALARQAVVLPLGDAGVQWGPVCLPSNRCDNWCILAVTRGGKTVVLRIVMQDTLYIVGNPLANPRQRARALIYDPKPELLPYAVAIQPHARFIITNPSDARASRWDLAKDFTRLSSAAELARLLVPVHLQQHDTFYPKAVRAVLTQVFKAFMLTAPGQWTLRDVFEVMKSERDLQHLLNRTAETRGTLDRISRNAETRGNIDISLHVELEPYRVLAARWHHCSEGFSLSEWMQSESILVVGRVDEEKQLFDAVNTLLLNRTSEVLLSQRDNPDLQTYMYLDELATVGSGGFKNLEGLMTKGLSKRVSVILASQGVEGLRQQFGIETTETLLSMCSNKAFLCLSRATAEWAVNQVGKTDWLELYHSWSQSFSSGGSISTSDDSTQRTSSGSSSFSSTTTAQRNERYAQMPEEFQHIAKPNRAMVIGLSGTFLSDSGSGYGIVPTEIPAESLFGKLLLPPDPKTEPFIPRPDEHDLLPPWSEEDRVRLGFPRTDGRAPLDVFLE
jgi:Type IV secretion-system coupling protein DNA-binding domain